MLWTTPTGIECDVLYANEGVFENLGFTPEEFADSVPVMAPNYMPSNPAVKATRFLLGRPSDVHCRASYVAAKDRALLATELGYLNLKGTNFELAKECMPRFCRPTQDIGAYGLDIKIGVENRINASKVFSQVGLPCEINFAVLRPKVLPLFDFFTGKKRWVDQEEYSAKFYSSTLKEVDKDIFGHRYSDYLKLLLTQNAPFVITARILPSTERLGEYLSRVHRHRLDTRLDPDAKIRIQNSIKALGIIHGIGYKQVFPTIENWDAVPGPVDLEDTKKTYDSNVFEAERKSHKLSIYSTLKKSGTILSDNIDQDLDIAYHEGRQKGYSVSIDNYL